MIKPVDFNLPISDIKDFLYSDCLSKFNTMLTDALAYFTLTLYQSDHDTYLDNLKKILPELIKIDELFSNIKDSPAYTDFYTNRIRLISCIFEHLSVEELNSIGSPKLLSKMSPASFLYLNYDNNKLVDRLKELVYEWWDECFNIYDFLEYLDNSTFDTDKRIGILQSVCRFCYVFETPPNYEDNSFYIAYGVMNNIQKWLLDIAKSDSSFKYTLLTYRQLFIQNHSADKLSLFDALGHEIYGVSSYNVLCSMVDNSSQACNPLFWKDMHHKMSMDLEVQIPELLTSEANY